MSPGPARTLEETLPTWVKLLGVAVMVQLIFFLLLVMEIAPGKPFLYIAF